MIYFVRLPRASAILLMTTRMVLAGDGNAPANVCGRDNP